MESRIRVTSVTSMPLDRRNRRSEVQDGVTLSRIATAEKCYTLQVEALVRSCETAGQATYRGACGKVRGRTASCRDPRDTTCALHARPRTSELRSSRDVASRAQGGSTRETSPQGRREGKERAQRRRDEDAPERSEEGPSRMSAVPTPGAQRGVNFAYALWPLLEHRTHQRSIDAWIHALTCENRSYTGDPYTGPSHPYTRIQVNFVAPVLQA